MATSRTSLQDLQQQERIHGPEAPRRPQEHPTQPWESFRQRWERDIHRGFQDLRERWNNIFTQEETRGYQAGKEWKLAREADGHLSWEPYPKDLPSTVQDFQHVLREMRDAGHARQRPGREEQDRGR